MPARLRDLARVLRELGIAVEEPTGGSHWKARRLDGTGRPYPLAAHNGPRSEITEPYLRGVCKHFGLDLAELRKKL